MPHVAVGTVHCISRLVSGGHLSLDEVRLVVLDEVDHLLLPFSQRETEGVLAKVAALRGVCACVCMRACVCVCVCVCVYARARRRVYICGRMFRVRVSAYEMRARVRARSRA